MSKKPVVLPPAPIEVPMLKDSEIRIIEAAKSSADFLAGEVRTLIDAITHLQSLLPNRRVAFPPRHETTKAATAKVPAPAVHTGSAGTTALGKAERAIMTCLAQFGACSKAKVAAIACYSVNGGGFNNALGSLRSQGFINKGEPIEATATGLGALGRYEPLPTGDALVQHWMRQLGKAEAAILRVVCERYPSFVNKEEVAQIAGYEANGGGFNNALGRLRTLELITRGQEIKASDHLLT